jgi:hypothetical protein
MKFLGVEMEYLIQVMERFVIRMIQTKNDGEMVDVMQVVNQ